jgi:hypothetical protein
LSFGGVDAHSDTHEAAALDERGGLLGTASFATTFAGYAGLLEWLRSALETLGSSFLGGWLPLVLAFVFSGS